MVKRFRNTGFFGGERTWPLILCTWHSSLRSRRRRNGSLRFGIREFDCALTGRAIDCLTEHFLRGLKGLFAVRTVELEVAHLSISPLGADRDKTACCRAATPPRLTGRVPGGSLDCSVGRIASCNTRRDVVSYFADAGLVHCRNASRFQGREGPRRTLRRLVSSDKRKSHPCRGANYLNWTATL